MLDNIDNMLIKNKSKIDKARLLQLATSDDNKSLINDLMSKDIPTQIKAFKMMSSKSDMIRLIQLKDALEKLEDAYIERALDDVDGIDMITLNKVITLVSDSVKRTSDTINRVTKDDDLMHITINNTDNTQIINNSTGDNNVSIVTDKSSREKLRNIMTKVMSKITKNNNTLVNATPTNLDNLPESDDGIIDIDEGEK